MCVSVIARLCITIISKKSVKFVPPGNRAVVFQLPSLTGDPRRTRIHSCLMSHVWRLTRPFQGLAGAFALPNSAATQRAGGTFALRPLPCPHNALARPPAWPSFSSWLTIGNVWPCQCNASASLPSSPVPHVAFSLSNVAFTLRSKLRVRVPSRAPLKRAGAV